MRFERVEVDLTNASISYPYKAHWQRSNALVGALTKPGSYRMIKRITSSPGYGGDVIQFDETRSSVYAIHRVWALSPSEKRFQRIRSNDPSLRKNITNGCINVEEDVYNVLLNECIDLPLIIIK